MSESTDEKKRSKIRELVSEYVKSKPEERFIPGKSWVRYAGRVFDENEYLTLTDAVLDAWITAGRFSEEFEFQLAKYLGVYSSLLVNSGSSANLVALSSLTSPSLGERKINKDDEVITVAAGFPTTVNPIIQNGAVPVFVDVDEGTYNINVDQLEDAINDRTKAIMVAHTLGNPFDVAKVCKIVKDHNLYLIEDNCDALGSKFDGKLTGTFGDLSTLSFYPAHHITMGEGGAVNTNSPNLERIARSFRDWGRDCYCETGASDSCGMRFTQKFGDLPLGYDHKYVYSHIGYNLKATDLQAAIGVAQLKKVDSFINKRKSNFKYLYERLKRYDYAFVLPKSLPKSDASWFAFPLMVRSKSGLNRREVTGFLEKNKIMTRTLFAGNLTKHPAYAETKKRIASDLAITDRVMNDAFFIGVYPGITQEMLEYVGNVFDELMRRK
ncbi:MAG: lipopolysaccharide biosynthesis protein RfbH [Thermoplasmataceae archaeon]